MDLIAKGIAGLIVCGALLLLSREGLLDTQATREVFQVAARLGAQMTGER
jgi:hypothetical protein